jgi:hypothetical protein
MCLGSGFPFADEAIVDFVRGQISEDELSVVSRSPVEKARSKAFLASSSSSGQQPAAARIHPPPMAAPALADRTVPKVADSPSSVTKDNGAAKLPELTIVSSSPEALRVRAELVWNHAVAVGLIQSSFEKCKDPYMIFADAANTNISRRLGCDAICGITLAARIRQSSPRIYRRNVSE